MARVGGMPLPTITDDSVLGESAIQKSLRFNLPIKPVNMTWKTNQWKN